ncbi:MAG: hypothetical protein ACMUIE_06535 [Thermoplasmatota archaeon]
MDWFLIVFLLMAVAAGILIYYSWRNARKLTKLSTEIDSKSKELRERSNEPPVDLGELYPKSSTKTAFYTAQALRYRQSPEVSLEFIENMERRLDFSEDPKGDLKLQVEKVEAIMMKAKGSQEPLKELQRADSVCRSLMKHPEVTSEPLNRIYLDGIRTRLDIETLKLREKRRQEKYVNS